MSNLMSVFFSSPGETENRVLFLGTANMLVSEEEADQST